MDDILKYYKLILRYEVGSEKIQDYYRFVMGHYVPAMQGMGLEMTEAWTTAWGNGPGRQIAFVARDYDTVLKLLETEVWEELNDKLDEFVSDFDYKVVPYRQGFQLF
jgi:hypothetical protein